MWLFKAADSGCRLLHDICLAAKLKTIFNRKNIEYDS